jgi:hypothetical protein
MTGAPPRLRLLTASPTPPLQTGSPAPQDTSTRVEQSVLQDRLFEAASARDPRAASDTFSLTPPAPTTAPAEALLALDALLAASDPPTDAACSALAALAAQVPGRRRQVAAALGRAASSAAVDALLALPPASPGVLEALHRCFARGVRRDMPLRAGSKGHVLQDSEPANAPMLLAPPLLALDFRGSRASRFPELVRRAQALGQAPGAHFEALDLDGKRRYRLAFWPDRVPPLALAAALRASHLDLVWLHARLVKLQGTRLWLSGWSFDGHGPHSPTLQSHLLQAWLQFTEHEPLP